MKKYLFFIILILMGSFFCFGLSLVNEVKAEEVSGALGCYCKVDDNPNKQNETLLFDTQSKCESAGGSYADVGTLTECVWNVSGQQELNIENSNKTDLVVPDTSDLNKLGTTDMAEMIGKAIKMGTGILGSIALIMVLYGGILWMTSGGSAEKTKQAMDILLWSSLGIIVILASYGLVDYIFQAFK